MTETMSDNSRILIDGFLESAKHFPDRPALDVDDQVVSYAELAHLAGRVASTIRARQHQDNPLAAVLAHKSLTAYAGTLGALVAGKGYVPLEPHHPEERIRRSLEAAECDVVIVGPEALERLAELLPLIDRPITVIAPFVQDLSHLQASFPSHDFVGSAGLADCEGIPERPASEPKDVAYVIFTSGSTGVPKGVPIRNRNVVPFVHYMTERSGATETDRFTQISDLTFDLSIYPVWTCWENGACLCCVGDKDRLAPAKFVRDKEITVWTSVPSAVMMLKRMRLLKPGTFPSVRYSFFCGEPLPAASAQGWQEACPNSVVDNLYGPTEATCAITFYRWDGDGSSRACPNGIVPIGWPFEAQYLAIVDEDLRPVPQGSEGELCLAGSQVGDGYIKDPAKTADKYVRIPELGEQTWYRTGDIAWLGADGCHYFRGRIDFQVKILGHRIELLEVEQVIREAAGSEMVVCLPWPVVNGAAEGIVGFAAGARRDCDEATVLEHCREVLPEYMVPKRVYFPSSLPLNANGKVDRGQLTVMLKEGRFA